MQLQLVQGPQVSDSARRFQPRRRGAHAYNEGEYCTYRVLLASSEIHFGIQVQSYETRCCWTGNWGWGGEDGGGVEMPFSRSRDDRSETDVNKWSRIFLPEKFKEQFAAVGKVIFWGGDVDQEEDNYYTKNEEDIMREQKYYVFDLDAHKIRMKISFLMKFRIIDRENCTCGYGLL